MSIDRRIENEFSIARTAARVGAILMFIVSCPAVIMLITQIYGFIIIGITNEATISYWLATIADTACIILALMLITISMYHFSLGVSPYSQTEAGFVVASGIALIASWILEYVPGPTKDLLVTTNPIRVVIFAHDSPSLFRLAMGVLFICIAGTLSYARALKEDSDSIV